MSAAGGVDTALAWLVLPPHHLTGCAGGPPRPKAMGEHNATVDRAPGICWALGQELTSLPWFHLS